MDITYSDHPAEAEWATQERQATDPATSPSLW